MFALFSISVLFEHDPSFLDAPSLCMGLWMPSPPEATRCLWTPDLPLLTGDKGMSTSKIKVFKTITDLLHGQCISGGLGSLHCLLIVPKKMQNLNSELMLCESMHYQLTNSLKETYTTLNNKAITHIS